MSLRSQHLFHPTQIQTQPCSLLLHVMYRPMYLQKSLNLWFLFTVFFFLHIWAMSNWWHSEKQLLLKGVTKSSWIEEHIDANVFFFSLWVCHFSHQLSWHGSLKEPSLTETIFSYSSFFNPAWSKPLLEALLHSSHHVFSNSCHSSRWSWKWWDMLDGSALTFTSSLVLYQRKVASLFPA